MGVSEFTQSLKIKGSMDHKKSWAPKNSCLWTVALEKTLESPVDSKEIQPVHPKGNWFWIFIGRTHAEAETPILWPLDVRNWLLWKDPNAGKDWRQEEKGTTEDEMVRWHHWLDGHEFEQALRVGDEQGSLVCELDMTEWLNSTDDYSCTGFCANISFPFSNINVRVCKGWVFAKCMFSFVSNWRFSRVVIPFDILISNGWEIHFSASC